MGRPRKFDHDECWAMYATGKYTMSELARHFGVAWPSIQRVVDPNYREQAYRQTMRYSMQGTCIDCGGKCSTPRPGRLKAGLPMLRCQHCDCARKALANVRETTLHCAACDQWKPDAEFRPVPVTNKKFQHSRYRRYRHRTCRACETAARKRYRDNHEYEPCTSCGYPRLKHDGRNLKDTGLCYECWLGQHKKEVAA